MTQSKVRHTAEKIERKKWNALSTGREKLTNDEKAIRGEIGELASLTSRELLPSSLFVDDWPTAEDCHGTMHPYIQNNAKRFIVFNPIEAKGAHSDSDSDRYIHTGLQKKYSTLCLQTKITAYLQNGMEFGVSASWVFFLVIFHSANFSSTNQPSRTYILPWQPYNFSA